ncbi:MAG TPA: hypothetical protein VLM40_22280 [Gemmata sp.]|nr:hypothetical protein [Gemmata sp.]
MLETILINKSSETRRYPLFEEALKTGELSVELKPPPKGKGVGRRFEPVPRRPDALGELRAGESTSRFFTLRQTGYTRVYGPGEYTAQVKFKTGQGTVCSPPWKFIVLDIPPDAVLANYPITGNMPGYHPDARSRLYLEQVKVENRFYLVYRGYNAPRDGGKPYDTIRVTELPGKVEMTVEGVYENDKPLIVRYRASPTVTTTLTIDSVNGTVWNRSESPAREGDLQVPAPARIIPKRAPVK